MGDVALEWDPAAGSGDLVIRDDDVGADEGLVTAAILSLFTDRRAEDDDGLPGDDGNRRGWWADEFAEVEDDRIGSRLWLLDRSAKRSDVARQAEDYAREALAWMLEDAVAERVEVTASTTGDALLLAIEIFKPGAADPLRLRFSHAWESANWTGIP